MMPVTQVALWVFGLRTQAEDRAEDQAEDLARTPDDDASSVPDTSAAALAEVDSSEQDFLPLALRTLPPGSFPQLNMDFQSYDGTTDWDATLADPTINAPTRLSSIYAREIENSTAGTGSDLLVHIVVSDNNGLTQPQLTKAAEDSLATAQAFFSNATNPQIDVDLISTSSAQIEWRGTMTSEVTALYYPLQMELFDREGFSQSFDVQVPILSGDFIL